MPQNPMTVTVARPGFASALNITAPTVVKATPGRLVSVTVVIAGSAPGAAYDRATTAGVAAANQIAVLANTLGTSTYDWPCAAGIVVAPGTGQTVAVSFI